jgi:hypothetical protein
MAAVAAQGVAAVARAGKVAMVSARGGRLVPTFRREARFSFEISKKRKTRVK